jgi:DNA polymerase-3 subunit delta
MAQKKAFEVDSWLARPDPRISIVLLYGPDRGLVAERAKAFVAKIGLPLDDPPSVSGWTARSRPRRGRLLDEAPCRCSGRRCSVRNASGQKALADDVKALTAEPPRGPSS